MEVSPSKKGEICIGDIPAEIICHIFSFVISDGEAEKEYDALSQVSIFFYQCTKIIFPFKKATNSMVSSVMQKKKRKFALELEKNMDEITKYKKQRKHDVEMIRRISTQLEVAKNKIGRLENIQSNGGYALLNSF